jgi:para-nitrobenzyl esterase
MCAATITQGGLNGKLAGTTCEYLGVPYGAAPTASLRFMPPQPAPAWSAPRDATAFGPSCEQASQLLGGGGNSSEDCLSVNVFTPQAAPAAPLPVMAFIYGGGFTSGASSPYDGALLSERGPVVVVTMNYRLGALGFLALPQLDSQRAGAPSGSDGIRDQQLALKWVQENIATFHGDPTNVTVFGESAGSMSACIHIVSPGSQGLANRYAMESGACVGSSTLLNTQAQAYELSEELAASFCSAGGDGGAGDGGADDGGDFDATSPDVLACLRGVDPTELMTWFPPPGAPQIGSNTLIVGSQLGAPFAPTVEGPGGVLPDTPANLIMQGKFDKDAAVLAGTNENEFGLFAFSATAMAGGTTSPLDITSTAQLDQDIEQVFGAAGAAQIEAVYPSTDATAAQVSIDLYTDYMFRCPTRDLARALTSQGTADYYLYSYDIGKAWHSFELLPLFDFTSVTILGATTPSPGFTHEMLGYWTQFAATGNPNAPGDAGAPAWPSYAATTDQYLELIDPTPMSIANLRKTQCDFWDSFSTPLAM